MMKKKRSLSLAIAISILSCAETTCNSTAVQLAQIPTTGGPISESGNYYLGYDITGNISIEANNVTLNLNGHTIQSLTIDGRNDVNITNGIVDGSEATTDVVRIFGESDNVHLSNLVVINGRSDIGSGLHGIRIGQSTNIFLSHILAQNNAGGGCVVAPVGSETTGAKGVFISDCVFNENGTTNTFTHVGLIIFNQQEEVVVRRCVASGNRNDGFCVLSNCQRIYFLDCIARENGLIGLPGDGFAGFEGLVDPMGPVAYVALRCIAENNGRHGFDADDGTSFIFENCLASDNASDGFNTVGTEIGLMKECTAIGNDVCGFDNQGVTTNAQPVTYVANYAVNNDTAQYCSSDVENNGFPYCTHPFDDDDAQFWRNIVG